MTLDKILKSTSEFLFPDEMGKKQVLVNIQGSEGDTPLHLLASWDDGVAVRILVEAVVFRRHDRQLPESADEQIKSRVECGRDQNPLSCQ